VKTDKDMIMGRKNPELFGSISSDKRKELFTMLNDIQDREGHALAPKFLKKRSHLLKTSLWTLT